VPLTRSIYGLGVRASAPLPWLSSLPPADRVDIDYLFGMLPPHAGTREEAMQRVPYVSTVVDPDGGYGLVSTRLASGDIRMDYRDGTVAVVEYGGRRVWAQWPQDVWPEDVACYLFGPVLGVVLRMRGTVALHASVIAMGDQAIAIAGPSGAGKSTTAAAFTRLGVRAMSDDVAALVDHGDGRFSVAAAHPHLRLWPDAALTLFGPSREWPRLSPATDKRLLEFDDAREPCALDTLPLAGIYCLGERIDGDAVVRGMPAAEAVMALLTDSFATTYLDREGRAREFDVVSRLVNAVPPRRVHAGRDLERIDSLCRAILADALR
jgi:hypothetical protein